MKNLLRKAKKSIGGQLFKRAKYVVGGEDGSLSLEQIILISVALVIATALFAFRGKITDFLGKAGKEVGNFQVA